jgi:flagellar hook-associated protein 2
MLPISFGGIASGMDTNAIINGLVGIERQAVRRIESRRSETQQAVSTFSALRGKLENLQDLASKMSDAKTFGRLASQSSDEAVLTTSAEGNADTGNLNVLVERLAKADKVMSNRVSDKSQSGLLTPGSLELTIGDDVFEFNITEDTTLEDLKDAINTADADFSASIINDGEGYRLTVGGTETGLDKSVGIRELGGSSLGLDDPGNVLSQAQDAQILVDGQLTITSGSNTFEDVMEGVTLDIHKTSDEAVDVSIERDEEGQAEAIQEFVDAYNDVTSFIDGQIRPADVSQRAMLHNDSTMRSIRNQLRETLRSVIPNGSDFNSATRIGLETTTTGELKLDKDKLEDALAADFSGVLSVFTKDSSGLADLFDKAIDVMIEDDGLIENRTDGLNRRVRDLNKRIDGQNRRVDSFEARLRTQFQAMERMISDLNTQSSFLQSKLGIN